MYGLLLAEQTASVRLVQTGGLRGSLARLMSGTEALFLGAAGSDDGFRNTNSHEWLAAHWEGLLMRLPERRARIGEATGLHGD